MNKTVLYNTRETKNSRAAENFHEQQIAVFRRTDRIFSILLPIQWLAAVAAACFLSPLTWKGAQSKIHPHVWLAVFVGGIITALPFYLTVAYPGKTITRYMVSISQMLMSSV